MKTRKRLLDYLVRGVTAASVAIILLSLAVMLFIIAKHGLPGMTWTFLSQSPQEGMMKGGIFPAIVGTFYRVVFMTLVGVPVGTLTALFLCEYVAAGSPVLRVIRFAVNTLAGIPSIVFGLFGLGFFIQFVGPGLDRVIYDDGSVHLGQPNLLWASLTMAVLTLPVVIVSVEEAIRNVPRDIREASLALGATRWQTVWRVVVPHSLTGVLTGAVLAVSRGAGEVAPILFTGAAYFLPHLPGSLSDQFMDMGYHIYIMSTQSSDVDASLSIQYSTTLTLLALTFGLNLFAILLRNRLRRRAA